MTPTNVFSVSFFDETVAQYHIYLTVYS